MLIKFLIWQCDSCLSKTALRIQKSTKQNLRLVSIIKLFLVNTFLGYLKLLKLLWWLLKKNLIPLVPRISEYLLVKVYSSFPKSTHSNDQYQYISIKMAFDFIIWLYEKSFFENRAYQRWFKIWKRSKSYDELEHIYLIIR